MFSGGLLLALIAIGGVLAEDLKFEPRTTESLFSRKTIEHHKSTTHHTTHTTPHSTVTPGPGQQWAVLVAGSEGWSDYRHQADIMHAYKILQNHGIPKERIVLMIYDDLADNPQNPTPGIVINQPGGPNMYVDLAVDYSGEDVTPENFLAVLSGDPDALKNVGSGKVIESGPNDHIFVNFVGHGSEGLLVFPTEMLYAPDLINTVKDMHAQNRYAKMVMYIESCFSGSMFEKLLPEDINVYATTAANPHEYSWGCYWDTEYETCLGDTYSVSWMENSDCADLNEKTLEAQYQVVKEHTPKSEVMQYGNLDMAAEACGEFLGNDPDAEIVETRDVPKDSIRADLIPLFLLFNKLQDATEAEAAVLRQQMRDLLEHQDRVHRTLTDIVKLSSRDQHQVTRMMTSRYSLTNYDCHQAAVELFDERCFDVNKDVYALSRLYLIVNLCEERVPIETLLEAVDKICSQD